jgi:hypothetical protein
MIRIFHEDQINAVVMCGAGQVAYTGKIKQSLQGFSGKVDGKRPLGTPRHRGNNNYNFQWFCNPARAMASSFTRFLDQTQRRTTVGRTPLDE